MVDFASKIKAQKAKDRERAKKKRQSVRGDRPGRPDKAQIPRRRKRKDSSDALMKGITDLFKEDFTSDPGLAGAYDMPGVYDFDTNPMSGYKKGGRLKKAGKRKRAAIRGQRSELRGS